MNPGQLNISHTLQQTQGMGQLNACRQTAQQLIQQTQQSNQQYRQMLHQEQQNIQMLQQILAHEQQAAQTIQQSLHAHEVAIQQCQQVVQMCNQLQQEMSGPFMGTHHSSSQYTGTQFPGNFSQ
ncbi:hypothetical protein ACQCVH_15715 [Bacillus infantis]|uniref:hypothetical protein n=1 Tax=Bacillus infantis TaxID=324767 RepID=UPI003CF463E9